MTMSMLLLAAAVLILPPRRWLLYRVVEPPDRPSGEARWLGKNREVDDPFAIAAGLDLFAVCLRAGLTVPASALAVAQTAPATLAEPLTATAELLELGAEPERAWSTPLGVRPARRKHSGTDYFEQLSMLARRSARAGSALSAQVGELATETRRRAHDDAHARAERAGVLVSGPLGLCFLPAFVCLGIVPVVIGLAGSTLSGL
ncbi:type II secretion system F family protein [Gordonia sputi]|uniref:Type II secretion system protein GspF domain-containing protein n=1 Tax=Gordonia sputi NBRC 100414 TaxID=1089453 RepID=H5U5S6_9ACTN|nr:type II secretion system F family protein [Gordonia sputi]NKY94581.1 type II secretion system F family protein [Gordonia sputi]GAB41084.1 hypothetical protein GOSPT_119_00350 [Gordonia sputi NBRC 100414]